jgi:hypothetical protein
MCEIEKSDGKPLLKICNSTRAMLIFFFYLYIIRPLFKYEKYREKVKSK